MDNQTEFSYSAARSLVLLPCKSRRKKRKRKGGTHKTALNPYLQEKTRNFKALLITNIVYNDFIGSQNEVLTAPMVRSFVFIQDVPSCYICLYRVAQYNFALQWLEIL